MLLFSQTRVCSAKVQNSRRICGIVSEDCFHVICSVAAHKEISFWVPVRLAREHKNTWKTAVSETCAIFFLKHMRNMAFSIKRRQLEEFFVEGSFLKLFKMSPTFLSPPEKNLRCLLYSRTILG